MKIFHWRFPFCIECKYQALREDREEKDHGNKKTFNEVQHTHDVKLLYSRSRLFCRMSCHDRSINV